MDLALDLVPIPKSCSGCAASLVKKIVAAGTVSDQIQTYASNPNQMSRVLIRNPNPFEIYCPSFSDLDIDLEKTKLIQNLFVSHL